jgi:hypothetical protein
VLEALSNLKKQLKTYELCLIKQKATVSVGDDERGIQARETVIRIPSVSQSVLKLFYFSLWFTAVKVVIEEFKVVLSFYECDWLQPISRGGLKATR